jgi:glycogen(starch) synthase
VRIALASREVFPLRGGGIGLYVTATARLLSRIAEVSVFTTSAVRPLYEELAAAGDPRLPEGVRFVFVPEPSEEEAAGWLHVVHCYSARLYEALRESYADAPPELVEFPDFLGEGWVAVQAAQALDPFLARTRLAVRLHTTAEIATILNGFWRRELRSRAVCELERLTLAGADRILWAGGDILETYRRLYGRERLAPAVRVRHPAPAPPAWPEPAHTIAGRPLRLLYAGRLERRKGVFDLVRAVTGISNPDLRLTLVGADTDTGPLGTSVRGALELEVADDPRIEIREALDGPQLAELIRAHDVCVIPSLWECWPYAGLEALLLNRPVLATPVGGLVELACEGRGGWLAVDRGHAALEEALSGLLERTGEVERLIRAGAPLEHGRSLCSESEILAGYEQLARAELHRALPRAPAPPDRARGQVLVGGQRAAHPLVSAIVPYHRAWRYVEDAVASLLEQSYPALEVVIVNDGSFDQRDWLLAELSARLPVLVVSQMNRGLGAARNFGVLQSRGRYVLPLDADNMFEPEFVSRAVEILEARPELAYVTAWSRYLEEDGSPRRGPVIGYQPLGNGSALLEEINVAGDAAALLRRRVFDAGFRWSEELTSYEDWALYRRMRDAGHLGVVIPQRLLRYRVREDSMSAQVALPRRERLLGEIDAFIRENALRWTSSSG